ncbi:MAG TPA: AbrB/MazE/SpoVT family DNA-binding domain-containing protein [Thermoplasmata archaeon]|nr:AbrB/MazE/SpoVT family DNA-binding domain-containing protein [Thermoplasmata archaeon]
MNVRTVRVSEKGQIAIPAKIRRSLGLRKGSTLLLMEDKGRLLVTKAERVGDILVDDFSDLTKHAEATFRELWQNRPDEVWDDV